MGQGRWHRQWLALLVLAGTLTGCGAVRRQPPPTPAVLTRTDAALAATVFTPPPPPPGPLFDPAIPLGSPPVAIPMEFRIPAQGVDMPMLAVGRASGNLIDAPQGPADDPIWKTAFLFRGGAAPGENGITTVIGHVDDPKVRPDPFAGIRLLHAGDVVELFDQRSAQAMHYRVTETRVVWEAATHSTATLASLFGAGTVTQRPADKAADAAAGTQRLTMMTCTGQWRGHGFDRRFFAFAVRDESVAPSG